MNASLQKVIVIGSPGAGKSSFARALRDLTGLPLYYLDRIWHKPDQTTVTREEFDRALEAILSGERWIIDGNYSRTLELRMQAADTVFLLDYPVEVCLEGIRARIGRPREDMPWVEKTFDPEFCAFIKEFPQETLPKIYDLLARYGNGKRIVIFHSREESEAYLTILQKGESLC